jgi:hypothetical protein
VPDSHSSSLRVRERWHAWHARRRATRNRELLEAGQLLPEPAAGKDPIPPVTDAASWLK